GRQLSRQCLAICHTNSIVLPQKASPILNVPIAVAEGISARTLYLGDDAARFFAGPEICDLRERKGHPKMGSATKRLATHGICSSIGRGYIDRYSVPRGDPE